jgi:hypothetical protein
MSSFEDIVNSQASLYGKSADEVAAILGEGWTKAKYGVTGTGKFTKDDKVVFYHDGGRHAGPHYGFSSGATGKVKIHRAGISTAARRQGKNYSRSRPGKAYEPDLCAGIV